MIKLNAEIILGQIRLVVGFFAPQEAFSESSQLSGFFVLMTCPTCEQTVARKVCEGIDYDSKGKTFVFVVYKCDTGHKVGASYPAEYI